MEEKEKFNELMHRLETGELRVATREENGSWTVHPEVKEMILTGFRLGKLTDMSTGTWSWIDKDTYPARQFGVADGVRIVPGGSTVRRGAYLSEGVVVMPPSYVNVGAYVDRGTMVDSHVLVGSCAQIGKGVHLSAGVQIGGVLEPVGALPVIVEDNVFIGGNCGIYEGTRVCERAVIGSGVIINSATGIYDAVHGEWIRRNAEGIVVVPAGAVVVAGSRPVSHGPGAEAGIQVYCPVIVKYRDEKTDASTTLEEALR